MAHARVSTFSPVALCLLAPLLTCAGGCGYQQKSLYRDDVRTVAVPVFTNRTFHQGLELALSKAVVNQLEAKSPYKVVSQSSADTILEGQVVEAAIRVVSKDVITNLPREQNLTVAIDFVWKDLRTGAILRERRNFQHAAVYYPTLGEGEFHGAQQVMDRLALMIVQEMQADW